MKKVGQGLVFSTFFLFAVALSPMSNKATFAYLMRLQREIGFRFLPRDFRSVLKKCLNVYMTSLEAEFVRFKVKEIYLISVLTLLISRIQKAMCQMTGAHWFMTGS